MTRFELSEHPHRRRNPLTGEWVSVAPHRTRRPWQGRSDPPDRSERPRHDPGCYLCPGNERAGGERNPDYDGTFVFDNDFASLQPTPLEGRFDVRGLLVAEPSPGLCRVLCFSPRHDLSLAGMPRAGLRRVVDLWIEQTRDLGRRPDVREVFVFENRGEMMGASSPHPHGQVWATASATNEMARESRHQLAFAERHGRPLLSDVVELELELGERLVATNDHFVALVPFWATWPFETLVLPRRAVATLPELEEPERDALAELVGALVAGYDRVFDAPFPYSMGWHQAPFDDDAHPEWVAHAHFYPPLLRSASVRKFMVGYEMLAEPVRDLTPEVAAARLRECVAPHTSR